MNLQYVPREYIDELTGSVFKEFKLDAMVKTESGVVEASTETMKGKRLVPPDDEVFKGLSKAYSGMLSRFAVLRGLPGRKFHVRIVPTDVSTVVELPGGKITVHLTVVEVYRDTGSSRRRVFQYGTVSAGKRVAVFNPLGTFEGNALPGGLSAGREDFFQFAVLKALSGDGRGSYFNFPAVVYYTREREGGYVFAVPGGGEVAFVLRKGAFWDFKTVPSLRITGYRFGDDVIVERRPDGVVEHYPTLLASVGSVNVRFFLSARNPDVLWVGRLVARAMTDGRLPVKVFPDGKKLIASVTAVKGGLVVREAGDGFVRLAVKGENPFKDSFEVVNARLPGVSLFAGNGFGAGVVFNYGKFSGGEAVVKGAVALVSGDGKRIIVKRVRVAGRPVGGR